MIRVFEGGKRCYVVNTVTMEVSETPLANHTWLDGGRAEHETDLISAMADMFEEDQISLAASLESEGNAFFCSVPNEFSEHAGWAIWPDKQKYVGFIPCGCN